MTQYITNSLQQFFEKITVECLANGYKYYFFEKIPEGKNVDEVDEKIAQTFDFDYEPPKVFRLLDNPQPQFKYVRYENYYFLAATNGYIDEKFHRKETKDIGRNSISFKGYTISMNTPNNPNITINKRKWKRIVRLADRIIYHDHKVVQRFVNRLDFISNSKKLDFQSITEQQQRLIDRINNKRKEVRLPSVTFNKP